MAEKCRLAALMLVLVGMARGAVPVSAMRATYLNLQAVPCEYGMYDDTNHTTTHAESAARIGGLLEILHRNFELAPGEYPVHSVTEDGDDAMGWGRGEHPAVVKGNVAWRLRRQCEYLVDGERHRALLDFGRQPLGFCSTLGALRMTPNETGSIFWCRWDRLNAIWFHESTPRDAILNGRGDLYVIWQ